MKLKETVELDCKVLDVVRHIIRRDVEKGLLPNKCNFFKVLARGTLNKGLKFEANDYSRDAIKMILLTGGQVTILIEK